MKKQTIIGLILSICTMLLVTSCSGNDAETMLSDKASIEAFLQEDAAFIEMYTAENGEAPSFVDSSLHQLDITGDGQNEAILVNWKAVDSFDPVIVLTVENGAYKVIASDLRTTQNSTFYIEDGFVLVKEDNCTRLAKFVELDGVAQLKRCFASFSNPESQGLETVARSVVEKIDGYNHFTEVIQEFYIADDRSEHLVLQITLSNVYNEETGEMDVEYTYDVENDLNEIKKGLTIVGNNETLQTFAETLEATNSLSECVAYYNNNRNDFSEETRVAFIEKMVYWIDSHLSPEKWAVNQELTEDGFTISLSSDATLPTEFGEDFAFAHPIYLEDGTSFTFRGIDSDYPTIQPVCVNFELANALRDMIEDAEILTGELFIELGTPLVDAIYSSKEETVEAVSLITYPNIVVYNQTQIESLQGTDLWKANLWIVPSEVTYVEPEM